MGNAPTTVLVVTSLEDVTANLVIEALNERRVRVVRVDPGDIGAGLTFSAGLCDGRTQWTGRLRTASRDAPHPADGNTAAIWTQSIKEEDLDESVAVTAHMFQREVSKTADARVTVVGRSVFASRITTPDGALDWRCGDWDALAYEPIAVPDTVEKALHSYLDGFGLAFGCFDFALGPGNPRDPAREAWTFIECNPNGQWGWLPDSDAIARAFADVLTEEWWR